jgi:hypothetical protein
VTFGVMFMRERSYGGWLWIINMAACGVCGVQMRFMGHLGWGYERTSRGDIERFVVILDLTSVIAPKLDSGMI